MGPVYRSPNELSRCALLDNSQPYSPRDSEGFGVWPQNFDKSPCPEMQAASPHGCCGNLIFAAAARRLLRQLCSERPTRDNSVDVCPISEIILYRADLVFRRKFTDRCPVSLFREPFENLAIDFAEIIQRGKCKENLYSFETSNLQSDSLTPGLRAGRGLDDLRVQCFIPPPASQASETDVQRKALFNWCELLHTVYSENGRPSLGTRTDDGMLL